MRLDWIPTAQWNLFLMSVYAFLNHFVSWRILLLSSFSCSRVCVSRWRWGGGRWRQLCSLLRRMGYWLWIRLWSNKPGRGSLIRWEKQGATLWVTLLTHKQMIISLNFVYNLLLKFHKLMCLCWVTPLFLPVGSLHCYLVAPLVVVKKSDWPLFNVTDTVQSP